MWNIELVIIFEQKIMHENASYMVSIGERKEWDEYMFSVGFCSCIRYPHSLLKLLKNYNLNYNRMHLFQEVLVFWRRKSYIKEIWTESPWKNQNDFTKKIFNKFI